MVVRDRIRFLTGALTGRRAAATAAAAALLFITALAIAVRRRRDVERRAAEREYEVLTSTLLANLSHELFTPLTPVKGYLSMLKQRDLSPGEVHEVADRVLSASDRLQHLLETLVGFADVKREGSALSKEITEIEDLVNGAASRVTQGRDRLTIQISGTLSAQVNRRLLGLAIWALIDNAIKFSPDGAPVRVSAGPLGGGLRIAVSDEGPGIRPAEIRTAFASFRQLDSSSTRRFGGLGIGIAFAEHVARAHGGRLLVSSTPGQGSTFAIELPVDAQSKNKAA